MTSMFGSKRSVRRLVRKSMAMPRLALIERVVLMKLPTALARPNVLSVWGLSLFDISRMLRMASSMT